jgi:hypothetical protein
VHGAGKLPDQCTPFQQRRVASCIEIAEDGQPTLHVVEQSLLQRVGQARALPASVGGDIDA